MAKIYDTTVEYRERLVDVEYQVIWGDEEVRYYPDGSGYPGMHDEIIVLKVYYNGRDVTKKVNHEEIADIIAEMHD